MQRLDMRIERVTKYCPPKDNSKQFPGNDEPIRRLAAGCPKIHTLNFWCVSNRRLLKLAPCFHRLKQLTPHGWGECYFEELKEALADGATLAEATLTNFIEIKFINLYVNFN